MQKRLNNISLLRMISFLCIIVYHLLMKLSSVERWSNGLGAEFFPLYFAVQIFLFISGFLYSNKKVGNIFKFYFKNLTKLLIPVLIWITFDYLINGIIDSSMFNIQIWVNTVMSDESFAHLWFVWAILICYLLLPLVHFTLNCKGKYSKPLKCVLILGCVAEFVCDIIFNARPVFFVFILGVLFGRLSEKQFSEKRNISITISTVVLFLAEACYLLVRNFFYSQTNQTINSISYATQRMFAAFMGISFTILFIYLFDFLNKKKSLKILKLSDRYSYYIYVVHQTLILGAVSVFKLPYSLFVNICIFIAGTFLSAIIVEYISSSIIKIIMTPKSPDPYKVIQKVLNDKDFK